MAMNHIVLLAFKDDAKAEPLFRDLGALRSVIPEILSYIYGPYSSDEGLNAGYTHAFVMVFADAVARDRYLTHPDHEKVKADYLPFVSQFVAFDFASDC